MHRTPFVTKTRVALAAMTLTLFAACSDDPVDPTDGPPPSIFSVEPATGTVGTDLRVTGANFRMGASASIGSLAASRVDFASASEVFARVPSGVVVGETYDVTVRNSDGTSVTFLAAFTPVEPTLSFVNGATRPSGNAGSTVILEGSAFGDAQGPGRVLFSDGAG
ncbi:MAG TPA: IPT/TIG domain-containing protein, partial [Longimicrobiales bacterium]|nr:IPT/TIG domain-containing protein [Longimicrobiales bacterium]